MLDFLEANLEISFNEVLENKEQEIVVCTLCGDCYGPPNCD